MSAEDLEHLLLRRRQTVCVEPAARAAPAAPAADGPAAAPDRRVAEGLTALEAELARRGHVLTAPLRRALGALRAAELADHGKRLLAGIDALLGSDRTHIPLFRFFPESVPYGDAHSLYTTRIRAFLAARPEQPCMVCGFVGRVAPLRHCGHLVCGDCWTASASSCCEDCCAWFGCPVCAERYDTDGPTSPWAAASTDTAAGPGQDPAPDPVAVPVLRVLRLAVDREAAARAELAALLGRRTPLGPQDHDDLGLLLSLTATGTDTGWLPERIPLRESKARALHALLDGGADTAVLAPLLRSSLDTATDVLRLLCVRSGGDPDLLAPPPRMRGLPRPLRRLLLGVLDALPFGTLTEDLARHPALWKRAAEQLHPFEYAARHPRAALAFAALRGTGVGDGGRLATLLLTEAERHPGHVRLTGDRLRPVTWASRVEQALAAYDVERAAGLLAARPGELLRRLDHLLARAAAGGEEVPGAVVDALAEALPRTGPGPLLGALGALRARTAEGAGVAPYVHAAAGAKDRAGGGGTPRRVFFPRGRITRAYAVPDLRPPLPSAMVADVCALLEGEVLDRLARAEPEPGAAEGPPRPYDLAVLDAGLAALPLPTAERGSSVALVEIPRGSALPVPGDGGRVRLFLHWMQPQGTRVDLDLSVAMFDDAWRFLGLCDYTRLEYAGGAAVHSGDLTSAPAPHGATEYVDLDPARLARAGVRHLVTVVFSYNDVPFGELPDAFAGFMVPGEEKAAAAAGAPGARRTRGRIRRPRSGGAPQPVRYDPRSVRQRFELTGDAKVCMPMTVDLVERRARWTDVTLASEGTGHNVWGYRDRLARLGRDLTDSFGRGARVTLWDLACWRAAARLREDAEVCVRTDRGLRRYRRREGETTHAFASRLCGAGTPDAVERGTAGPDPAPGARLFTALVEADLPGVPADATGTAYRLHPGRADVPGMRLVAPGDLVAELGPRTV